MSRPLNKLFLLGAAAVGFSAAAADLRVNLVPRCGGAPLQFDSLSCQTAAGQKISVTRLDFLLSNIAFRRAGGVWVARTNWFACLRVRNGRTEFVVPGIPDGDYDRLRFNVGLDPAVNHSDPAQYPAGHPLNPQVNALHWGWTGGYVFLALEGAWQKPGGQQTGYSWHLANDPSLMTVELPAQPNVHFSNPDSHSDSQSTSLVLFLDLEKILPAEITETNASTHSRPGDPLSAQLAHNLESAFAAETVPLPLPALQPAAAAAPRLEIAPGATPYPLTFSRFFPRPALPADNPLTREGVALGRRLFSDPVLSVNNSLSCASCHDPARAFSDARPLSLGAEGKPGARHAPSLLNLAWKSSYFWDGRAPTLREQVLQPVQNPVEMHESLSNVTAKLAAAGYPAFFAAAFGSPEITADRVARALEQFLLAQVSCRSKFDRVLNRADKFTPEEQRGFELFHTEYDPRRGQFGADCFHCHGGPLLRSQDFANNGLDSAFPDAGRSAVTQLPGDRGKFAVPSLRNVELTGPYMHDGRFATLEEVVEHYCTGVKRSASLDPNLAKHPDGGVPLNAADKQALVAFLKTLTDEPFQPAPVLSENSAVPAPPPEARRPGRIRAFQETMRPLLVERLQCFLKRSGENTQNKQKEKESKP